MDYKDIEARLKEINDKIEVQLNNDQYSFLSQVELPEEDFEFLNDTFGIFFGNAFSAYDGEEYPKSRMCNLLTSIVAVNFGFYNYSEEGLWEDFGNRVKPNEGLSNKEREKIRKIIETVVKRYGLEINYEVEGDSVQKNINAILMQTFVPYNYLESFFDYAYSLYDDIRDDERYSDLYGFFEDLSINFRVPLKAGNQTSSLGGNRLINSTKRVLRDSNAFGPILEKIFIRIDCNNEFTEETDLGRFEEKFNLWFKKNQEIVQRSRTNRRRIARFLLDENNRLKLMVPSQTIGKNNDRGLLTLSSPGKSDVVIEAQLRYDSSGKKIEEYWFGREFQFFEKFELRLNDKNITPSLNMERFLIFNSYREQINAPVCGLFYVAVNKGIELQADNCTLYATSGNARIYVVRGKPASVICIGDKQFFIGTSLEGIRASIGVSNTGIVCQNEQRKMPVLPKHPTVCFDVGKQTARKTYVELVRGNRIVCTFRLAHAQIEGETSLKTINPNIGPNVEFAPDHYSLKIKIGKEITKYDYFLVPNIEVNFTENLYHDACTGEVNFGTDLITAKQFDTNEDAVEWNQSFEGVTYHFTLPIPSMKYDFGYGEKFDKEVDVEDLTSFVEVKCPLFTKPRLVIKYDNLKTYRNSSQSKSFYYDISDLKKQIEERKPSSCILLLSEGGIEEEIFSIDVPSVLSTIINNERTALSIIASHISKKEVLKCIVQKGYDKEIEQLSEEKPYIVDISNRCTVTVKRITKDNKEIVVYNQSFNVVFIRQDTGIDEDCKKVTNYILVFVDSERFYVDGSLFVCLLNNNQPYDPKELTRKYEERWYHLTGFNKKDLKLKSMFLKACKAVEDEIIQDELDRGNGEALVNLANKFQNTQYSSEFQDAIYRIFYSNTGNSKNTVPKFIR